MTEYIEETKSVIQSDINAADLRWSLFVAASKSYRYDSAVRPFPSEFIRKTDNEKDIEALRQTIEDVIPFQLFLKDDFCLKDMSAASVKLLHWVLLSDSVILQSMPKQEFETIQKITSQSSLTPSPSHIFKVNCKLGAQQFQQNCIGKKTFFAFHGSSLQNFHSILNNGLIAHLNKNGLYGKGTYLSSELSVSLIYSPMGNSWRHSIFGSQLSCVALCEIIDHPDVKCKGKGTYGNCQQSSPDSLAGDIPDKYYLVQNNDLVRIRYLLVYSNSSRRENRIRVPKWWWKYRFTILMLSYVVILVGISLSSSRTLQQFLWKHF
ncbi:protein mono-ADP-ribosyltransferase PARP16-like [Centruroides vittatus]|uniref:protein mono-ADP-ribosyltransferase PARP16-like n=1 Tax=Centruroides vittatus TaxID=120091 RepID=UPI00350F0D44